MARGRRRFSSKLKFQVVVDGLSGKRTPAQIAKAYRVHANSVGLWTKTFLERGPEIFEYRSAAGDSARRIAELERLLGQKEVEIALLKNFLGQSA